MGLRFGLALPRGEATGSRDALSDRFGVTPTLGVDFGARVTPRLGAALLFSYGLPNIGNNGRLEAACSDGLYVTECSASLLRIAALVRYRSRPRSTASLVGEGGVGYERVSQSFSDDVAGYSETVSSEGAALVLGGGLDLRLSPKATLGFMIDGWIGRYLHNATENDEGSYVSGAVDDAGLHSWLQLSLRLGAAP